MPSSPDDEEHDARDDPQDDGEGCHALGGAGLEGCVVVIGLLDDVVDDGAVRRIGLGDLGIGLGRGLAVALGERRQEGLLDRGIEALHLAMRILDQPGLERRLKVGLLPEIVALVIFLLQLGEAAATRVELGRIIQRQRRLEIGLDYIFRRRQDVGNKVVAELDLGIERTADLDVAQRIDAGEDHGGKASRGDEAEQRRRARDC
jgi:hypothetical protein